MDQDNTGAENPIAPEGASTTNENKPEDTNQTTVEPVPPATPTTDPITPPSTPTPLTDPKKPKGLITTVVILAILALAGIAFGIYGMFLKTQPNSQPEPNQTSNNTEEPTEEPTTTKNEETEITDTYVLRDLDEKIALLHFTDQTGSTLFFQQGTHPEFALYKNGTLNDIAKLAHVIRSLGKYLRMISYNEKQTILKDFDLTEGQEGIIERVIDADVVKEYYRDVFGEEVPTPGIYNDQFSYCPVYKYDSTLNVYFENTACGGTSPYYGYYDKTKYTKDENHAYVYVSTTVLDGENGQVYCEVVEFEDYSNLESCGTIDKKDWYAYSQEDLSQTPRGNYRFVFNKADNGTYYFNKVEKL